LDGQVRLSPRFLKRRGGKLSESLNNAKERGGKESKNLSIEKVFLEFLPRKSKAKQRELELEET
jgi:hypothetical protein